MSDTSSFTRWISQGSAVAMISETFGKTSMISSLVMCVFVMLFHLESTVHVQYLARNVIGITRGEKPHSVSHVGGLSNPPQQNPRQDFIGGPLTHFARHLGFDDARGHGVDRYAARGQFYSQRTRERIDGAFAGGVIGLASTAF